jgi:hypothetical protein
MSKTKRVKKRNKKFSRKNVYKGGDTSDDFVLIGFEKYNAPYRNPVFLPINCNLREPNVNGGLYGIGGKFGLLPVNTGYSLLQILILPQLYKLKNIRNIDLWDELIGNGVVHKFWNQNNGDIILLGINHLESGKSMYQTKEGYYNTFKNEIIKIELEYPGLFKPIFIDTDLTKDEMHNLTSDQKLDIEERAKDKIYKEEV